MQILSTLFFWGLFIILPIILFIRNCYFTFKYPKLSETERLAHRYSNVSERKNDVAGIILGAAHSLLWLNVFCLSTISSTKDYDEAAYVGQKHAFIHTEYGVTVWITLILGLTGLLVITIFRSEKIPPVPKALCFAFAVIAEVLFFFINVQLIENLGPLILPTLFYLVNVVMITARVTKRYITEHLQYKEEHKTVYIHESAEKLENALNSVQAMTELHFLMILPAAIILIALYILLGQGPDGIIKAFTMTADWTFSTQIPPPPIDYEGHYLCTVAAGGHKKVVKPVRYGKRRGEIIVVNRQLLASNAFEDMIMERTPKFHKAIRTFYDKHGYPISRHITTQTRADIVYILMKPLEWLFIACLYIFDAHPENRIAVQYSDYPKKQAD